jgi:hypothetical protein
MNEQKEINAGTERNHPTSEQQDSKPGTEGLSRRTFLGVGTRSFCKQSRPGEQAALG